MFGIVQLSLAPVRKEASDASEMVTQLLFGESFEILEKKNQWRKIRITFDQYEGWIDEKQCFFIESKSELNAIQSSIVSTDLVQLAQSNVSTIPLLLGSVLTEYVAGKFILGGEHFSFDGSVRNIGKEYPRKTVIDNAMLYLHAPYLWGGRSPFGIDCSGLTQMSYKLAGIRLWRDAAQQAIMGKDVHLIEQAVPGDLAFFDNSEGKIIHTGIIIAENKIIHASGKVRIDRIDHQGIFNVEKQKYTHNLRVLKKII